MTHPQTTCSADAHCSRVRPDSAWPHSRAPPPVVAGGSGGGSSSKTLKMLYFGDQTAATQAAEPAAARRSPSWTRRITFEIAAINGTDWNDFLAKVLTQIAAGTPPDIISVATEGLQLMAQKELAVPLDDYVTKDMANLKRATSPTSIPR